MKWGGHQGCALTSAVFPLVLALALVDDPARAYAYQDDLVRRADLLVLNEDPSRCDEAMIKDIRVDATLIDGQLVSGAL